MPALDGIRVIDAASFVTGPLAAMVLADLGADVVKVEPPGAGDPYRRFGKQWNGHGIPFVNANRGKQSIALDLRDDADAAVLERLLGHTDILITNCRPAAAARLHLDDALCDRHPHLIWIRVTGFGPDGPMANAPAFDSIIQARSGLASLHGGAVGPALTPSWMCDKVSALFAAQAALAALVARQQTGRGQLVDVPMLDSVAYFNFPDLMVDRTLVGEGDDGPVRVTVARPVRARDGWVVVNAVRGRQILAALTALGLEQRQAELQSITDGIQLSRALCDVVEAGTQSLTTEEAISRLAAHDVPATEVLSPDAHLRDPQVVHNAIYAMTEDARLGVVRRPRYPARPLAVADPQPAPGLDEDRGAVLKWLDDEVDDEVDD
jgi:crotonobetainyl-CoA:carnitine CoA-transferase CaiB-like acyl-CoA transferase